MSAQPGNQVRELYESALASIRAARRRLEELYPLLPSDEAHAVCRALGLVIRAERETDAARHWWHT